MQTCAITITSTSTNTVLALRRDTVVVNPLLLIYAYL
jgi:hypothetical protein